LLVRKQASNNHLHISIQPDINIILLPYKNTLLHNSQKNVPFHCTIKNIFNVWRNNFSLLPARCIAVFESVALFCKRSAFS